MTVYSKLILSNYFFSRSWPVCQTAMVTFNWFHICITEADPVNCRVWSNNEFQKRAYFSLKKIYHNQYILEPRLWDRVKKAKNVSHIDDLNHKCYSKRHFSRSIGKWGKWDMLRTLLGYHWFFLVFMDKKVNENVNMMFEVREQNILVLMKATIF